MSAVGFGNSELEPRLQEIEIKLAFLEKEVRDYRDTLHELHTRLGLIEAKILKLERAAADSAP